MFRIQLIALAVLPLLLTGCETMSHTDKGLVAGGGLGALAGGVIGNQTGHTAEGAVIGGAIGAVAGGLTGNAVDQAERKADARLAAATAAQAQAPLGLTDVAALAQQHISDDVIIAQIRTTRSLYRLSPSDIVWLKQNGVSDLVIQEMQATASRRVGPPVVYHPAPRVYVYEPPPPPVHVGVGFGYGWGRRRCW